MQTWQYAHSVGMVKEELLNWCGLWDPSSPRRVIPQSGFGFFKKYVGLRTSERILYKFDLRL